MKRWSALTLSLAAVATLAPLSAAQSNTVPGLDVKMGILGGLDVQGHQGTFPNGLTSMSMATTSCNVGTVNVPWLQAMNADHPSIAFMAVRESSGRMIQISDRSYVKHGFFALSSSQCTPCQNPSNGTFLGVGCSDTYGTGNNSDRFWLGPPQEINIWLGTWTPACSYFDRGDPPVAPGQQCDSNRSLSNGQVGAMPFYKNRVVMQDADLNVPGATFYYAGHYAVRAEAEDKRTNNMASNRMTVSWTGTSWNINQVGGTTVEGSVLQRWTGSTLTSGANLPDDGRVYCAVKVTGPTAGLYHYEYAFHNRDNQRAVGAVRIPLTSGATVSNFGFHDIDGQSGSDWSFTPSGTELVVGTLSNPLEWNTIYNVWFDSDAAPANDTLTLDAFYAGAGANSFSIPATAPKGGTICNSAITVYCSPKINSLGCVPDISGTGTPSATQPSGFTIQSLNMRNNKVGLLFYSNGGRSSSPFTGGLLCVGGALKRVQGLNSGGTAAPTNDCSGVFTVDMNAFAQGLLGGNPNPFLLVPGTTVNTQFWGRDPGFTAPDNTQLSGGLEYVICQ